MSITAIKNNIDNFKCPVCNETMILKEKSMVCRKNHCFDISKKGYVNLVLNAKKQLYDKELFISRSFICNIGFFNPLIDYLISLIKNSITNGNDSIKILDAGCGEGFHLSQIIQGLEKSWGEVFQGFGIDISKEGIQIASKKYKDIVWCVADLAKTPFRNMKFDFILNILSPSNYGEFERLMSHNGLLVKVVPGSNYLKELRNVFYEETEKENYSNDRVIEHFKDNFQLVESKTVRYDVPVNTDELNHLIKMTPLSWGADDIKIKEILEMKINNITADFTVLLGKRKEE